MRAARSLLYVPGDRAEWVGKARRSGTDAVILDLEDAVAVDRKAQARESVARSVAEFAEGCQLWVRVDPATLEADVRSAFGPTLTGIVLPKVEPALVEACGGLLARLERAQGSAPGATPLIGLLETAVGLEQIATIASEPRVRRLGIGEADLAGELGLMPDEDRSEFAPIRSTVVVASAAAGLDRPIGPVYTAVDDEPGLRRTTQQQLRQGFRGRTAVHPGQVALINSVFTPTRAELEKALQVLRAYEKSMALGVAALRHGQGQMMDAATVRSAEDVVARAEGLDAAGLSHDG